MSFGVFFFFFFLLDSFVEEMERGGVIDISAAREARLIDELERDPSIDRSDARMRYAIQTSDTALYICSGQAQDRSGCMIRKYDLDHDGDAHSNIYEFVYRSCIYIYIWMRRMPHARLATYARKRHLAGRRQLKR